MKYTLAINKDLNSTLKDFFSKLFDLGIIKYLLLPQEVPSGKAVVQSLISSKDSLGRVDPFAPVLLGNSARLLSDLTYIPADEKAGIVLRGCEIKAAVELFKLKQVNFDNIIIIGLECLGTVKPQDFKSGSTEEFLSAPEKFNIRGACQRCESPIPPFTDIKIGVIGCDIKNSIEIELSEKISGVELPKSNITRDQAIQELLKTRKENKEKAFSEFKEKIKNIEGFLNELALCRRCYNCRKECPLCACRECVFDTDTFKHQSNYFFKLSRLQEIIQMPVEKLLFHLTRLNHMVTSCVACGQCNSACPNDLPVDLIFSLIGQETQKLFDYAAGQSLEASPPLSYFKEEELEPR